MYYGYYYSKFPLRINKLRGGMINDSTKIVPLENKVIEEFKDPILIGKGGHGLIINESGNNLVIKIIHSSGCSSARKESEIQNEIFTTFMELKDLLKDDALNIYNKSYIPKPYSYSDLQNDITYTVGNESVSAK